MDSEVRTSDGDGSWKMFHVRVLENGLQKMADSDMEFVFVQCFPIVRRQKWWPSLFCVFVY